MLMSHRMDENELWAELEKIGDKFELPQKALDCVKEEDLEGLRCMDKHELWFCAGMMKELLR